MPLRHIRLSAGSNAGYKGTAVGHVNGETITFDLSENSSDRAGNAVPPPGRRSFSSAPISITVNYQVEFNNSGDVLTASVPFAKITARVGGTTSGRS